jgi:hypothetical protein
MQSWSFARHGIPKLELGNEKHPGAVVSFLSTIATSANRGE